METARTRPVRQGLPKLSVFTEIDTMKMIHGERLDTGLTVQEIVNRRLRESYSERPRLVTA